MKRSGRFFLCASWLGLVVGALLAYFGFFSSMVAVAQSPNAPKTTVALDLIGYNYTNHHIEDYEVNNRNGGIVRVSSPTSGGSGSICCIKLSPGESGAIFVQVRWQVDGCSYIEKDPITGNTEVLHHYLYKEAFVKVAPPAAGKPNHLETHFYPDGSVQVQITEEMSLPRVRLSEDRFEKPSFPNCINDQKPE
ncbi:conserved hypothetical protein [Ricinus communis]|uniref:DUF3304 domain-containing protein n=1 Tax=Ricinus communis TaxID=3988 RepID=B9TD06_RICCO|nr:conserved hypothetical protein [Ricinus communis]